MMVGTSVGTMTYCLILGVLVAHLSCRAIIRWRKLREPKFTPITPIQLKSRIDAGEDLAVLDLRHPLDRLASPYAIPGAIWISPDNISPEALHDVRGRTVVFYCTSATQSCAATMIRRLQKQGICRPLPIEGGLVGWRNADLPIEFLEHLSFRSPGSHAAVQHSIPAD